MFEGAEPSPLEWLCVQPLDQALELFHLHIWLRSAYCPPPARCLWSKSSLSWTIAPTSSLVSLLTVWVPILPPPPTLLHPG